IVDGRDIRWPWFRGMKSTVTAYVAVAFLGLAIPLIMRAVNAPEKLVTRRGVIAAPKKDTVINYVQAHVSPGETVLVYPYLPLYYYLTGTFAPTRYEYLQPGMNTPQQSLEMISDLASGRVQVVLFESSLLEKIATSSPGTPLSAIAHDPVASCRLPSFHHCKLLPSTSYWQ